MASIRLRTGAWYGDEVLDLDFPNGWDVVVWWPRTPAPMSDRDIVATLETPTNQIPIRTQCVGKRRPLLVVDDLNRPTPVAAIMPFVLAQFRDAGLMMNCITILVASGMHAPPCRESLLKKLGPEAVSSCRVITHDYSRGLARVGKTRRGTPVDVNVELLRSDFVLGIGGLYPNHTAGFGGGSKLALGVLGGKTIAHLHGHQGVGWGGTPNNDMRKELDEIARMLQMNTMITLHVDADRKLVKIHSGDHFTYYDKAIEFCRTTYSAPAPHDANVVVSNTYPNDMSLTFARMKGMAPLDAWAPSAASRVAIAGCAEGLGRHNLFPLARFPELLWLQAVARRGSAMSVGNIGRKLVRKFAKSLGSAKIPKPQKLPIIVYWTYTPASPVPVSVAQMSVVRSWDRILKSVQLEQQHKTRLKVVVYPCAPLQILS